MKTTERKRTRRPDNPYDARMEVRLYSTEKAKLLDEAAKRNMTGSDLIRSQLGNLMEAPPPEPPQRLKAVETPAEPSEAVSVPTSDLAEAISDVTGISWGAAMLKIRLGHVTVADGPWTDPSIPQDRLRDVKLDGEPLPIEPLERS